MAKRFTDTTKYKKPFIRSLKAPYKLLWDYLYHDCDHAGIWIVDFDIAQVYVGLDASISKQEAIKNFNSDDVRVIEFDEGKKWFIPSFIEFQYGELNPSNRAHQSVIRNLEKHNLLDFLKKENKPLKSPLQGAMDKDKEKELDKEKEKEFEKGVEKTFKACLAFFPEHLHPKDPTTWLDTIDKLHRIDGIHFEKIVEITQRTRGDDFWAKNFLSLVKLRKKDPNGIPYVVVFNEKLKTNGNRNHNQTRTDAQLKEAASNAVDRMFGQQ